MNINIAELILTTMEHPDATVKPGTFGSKMIEIAQIAMLPTEVDESDIKLHQKIQELKEFESRDDLAWLDFASWNCLSIPTRQSFSQEIDPLFWSGLYFSYSKFIERVDGILKEMDSGTTISIQKEVNNYRFICLNAKFSIYDYFGILQLDRIRSWYESTRYQSIGKTSTGELVIKTFKETKWV